MQFSVGSSCSKCAACCQILQAVFVHHITISLEMLDRRVEKCPTTPTPKAIKQIQLYQKNWKISQPQRDTTRKWCIPQIPSCNTPSLQQRLVMRTVGMFPLLTEYWVRLWRSLSRYGRRPYFTEARMRGIHHITDADMSRSHFCFPYLPTGWQSPSKQAAGGKGRTQWGTSGSRRGPWGPGPPLPPRFLQNHAVFREFLGKTPYFEQILGSGPPPWGQNSAGPPWPKPWIRALGGSRGPEVQIKSCSYWQNKGVCQRTCLVMDGGSSRPKWWRQQGQWNWQRQQDETRVSKVTQKAPLHLQQRSPKPYQTHLRTMFVFSRWDLEFFSFLQMPKQQWHVAQREGDTSVFFFFFFFARVSDLSDRGSRTVSGISGGCACAPDCCRCGSAPMATFHWPAHDLENANIAV